MKFFKKLLEYYRPHKKLFLVDMVCSLAVSVCDLFYPTIAKNIINDYVYRDSVRFIIVWALALLGIYVLKCVLNFIIQFCPKRKSLNQ